MPARWRVSPPTLRRALDRAGYDVVELTRTGAGKYISVGFFVERLRRYSTLLHHLARPALLFRRAFFYLNPRDEMIVVARPRP